MNIILLIVDSLNEKESIFLQDLFDVVYENYYVSDRWSLPNITTIFLGTKKHLAIGLASDMVREDREYLIKDYIKRGSLIKFFKKEGFATRAVTGGGWFSSNYGFEEGFDQFEEVTDDDTADNFGSVVGDNCFWVKHSYFLHQYSNDVNEEDNKVKFCKENAPKNWDDPLMGCYRRELYDAYVQRVRDLRRKLKWVKTSKDLIFLTADHGLSFQKKGSFHLGINAKLEAVSHVPLMVHYNGKEKSFNPKEIYDYQLSALIKEFHKIYG